MSNIEEYDLPEQPKRRLRFDWILPTLFRPGKTLREIAGYEASTWLVPVVLLSLLVIISAFVAQPLRTQAALAMPVEPPADFQYWTPDMQQEWMNANQPNTSFLFMVGFPALTGLAGVWIGWFLVAALMHVTLTLSGSRGSRVVDFSLAGWSLMPLAVREVVRIVAMLVTRQLIVNPGFSGFMPAEVTGGMAYLSSLLTLLDIYLVWQVVLLFLGARASSGLSRAKAFTAVLTAVVLVLALQALPGFIGAQLAGLSVNSPFFFF